MRGILKILKLTILLLFFNTVTAQTWLLQVNTRDGTKDTFNIEEIKKITFDTTTSIENNNFITGNVKRFKLFHNYPNPFNPTTNINFEVPKPGQVQISIYNSLGQLIRELSIDIVNVGMHTVTWDGKNQYGLVPASGLYICQVKFDNSVLVNKMVMLK